MFMKDFPIKSDNILKLRQWKDDMQNAINVGYESLKEYVVLNKVIKPTKNGEIRISAMKNKNSVKFFDNYRNTNNGLEEHEV